MPANGLTAAQGCVPFGRGGPGREKIGGPRGNVNGRRRGGPRWGCTLILWRACDAARPPRHMLQSRRGPKLHDGARAERTRDSDAPDSSTDELPCRSGTDLGARGGGGGDAGGTLRSCTGRGYRENGLAPATESNSYAAAAICTLQRTVYHMEGLPLPDRERRPRPTRADSSDAAVISLSSDGPRHSALDPQHRHADAVALFKPQGHLQELGGDRGGVLVTVRSSTSVESSDVRSNYSRRSRE